MNYKKLLKSNRKITKPAFTIIELVISLSIIAILLFISTNVTVRLVSEARKNDIRADIDRNVNFAIETIKRSIRQTSAKNINDPSCRISGSACCPNFTSCLSIGIGTGTGSFKVFQLNTNRVIMIDSSGSNDLTGDSIVVSTLAFDYIPVSGFIGITFKCYDTNQVLFKVAIPFTIATGSIVRN